MKRLLLIAALLMLTGCGVNEWDMSYRTLSEVHHDALPKEAAIKLVDCSTYVDDLYLKKVKEAETDAESLGYSHFNISRSRAGTSQLKDEYVPKLLTFARSIGADLVVYRISYVDTSSGQQVESYDVPRTDTSYITTTGRDRDGSKINRTTTVTTTSWETHLITRTVSIDHFSASAAYFRRTPGEQ